MWNLRNARFADDPAPLDPGCACPACTRHSRAYLHHLFRAKEMLGPMLLTWHNLAYYQDLMRGLRAAIAAGRPRRACCAPACRLGGRGECMSDHPHAADPLAGLTQLGRPSPLPAGPDAASWNAWRTRRRGGPT